MYASITVGARTILFIIPDPILSSNLPRGPLVLIAILIAVRASASPIIQN